ncbi:MAG: MFS transporter [Aeriscardovia sp.]|nr:MFS transporter [Aeriscardovia sp.]
MTSVETAIVTTALPAIGAGLNGLALQNWIFTIYLLTAAVSTTVYGRVADSFGRKPVFLIGLALFAVGSLMISMPELIVFRGLMGLGAAPS